MPRWLVAVSALVVAVASVIVIEKQGGFRGSRLIEETAVFGAAATLAWAMSGARRNGMIILCSLIFGIAVIEAILPLLGHGHEGQASKASFDDFGLTGPIPLLGWGATRPGTFRVVKKNDEGHVLYDVRVTIDPALDRVAIPSGDQPIAFFGDSYIFGDGVNDADTLPQAFSDLNQRRIPVLNLAFSGWSPAQNLLALMDGLYRPLLNHPRHFILFTSAFHIERTACKAWWAKGGAPRFVLKDGRLAYAGPCLNPYLSSLAQFATGFALYRRIAPYFHTLTPVDAETYRKIVEAFVTKAHDLYNVKTTILYERYGDDYTARVTGHSDDDFVAMFRRAGLDVLVDDLPPIADPSLYSIPEEGHPTPLAYLAMAREIETHLKAVDPAALEIHSQ